MKSDNKDSETPLSSPSQKALLASMENENNLETEMTSAFFDIAINNSLEKTPAAPLDEHFTESCGLRILWALRKIMHAVSRYSRKLAAEYNITGPQLICLYAIVQESPLTLSALVKRLSLSASTVNGILDRLEIKGFIVRERKDRDRRKVLISATETGIQLTMTAPLPLQDKLVSAIANLPELEQATIVLSLERIVEMMESV